MTSPIYSTHLRSLISILFFTFCFDESSQGICDINCMICDGYEGECLYCKLPWRVTETYYSLFRNTCYPCPTGCQTCVMTVNNNLLVKKCTECASAYELGEDGQCSAIVYSIPPNYCLVEWCDMCNFMNNLECYYCTHGDVKLDGSCYGPDDLPPLCTSLDQNGLCSGCVSSAKVGTEQKGLYLSSPGNCTYCSEKCEYCQPAGTCLMCNMGYWLQNETCVPCPPNCLECDQSTGACITCMAGYFTDVAGLCSPCFEGCSKCSGPSEEECWRCDITRGYVGLFGKNCRQIASVCADLHMLDGYYDENRYCLSCISGTYPIVYPGDYNLDCQPCPSECLNCESPTICSRCKQGFYLSNSKCLPCTGGCQDCVSPHRCLVQSNEEDASNSPKVLEFTKKRTFFISYRLQAKIVWRIIFCEGLMIVYRIIEKLVEIFSSCISDKKYRSRSKLNISTNGQEITESNQIKVTQSNSNNAYCAVRADKKNADETSIE